jgi:hypothetical protein
MNRSRYVLLAVACLLVSTAASGEEVVRSISWQELAAARKLTSGTVVQSSDGVNGPSLRVVHKRSTPSAFPLVTIEQPGIIAMRYALRGRVRYEDVAAGSYLEMWNHLPEGTFFTRSMDLTGPMGRLEGTSAWRDFVLPFNRTGALPPQKLVFNLVMAGPGTVEIGPVTLVILGAAIGWLGSTGRAKAFVLGTLKAFAWLGIAALVLGVVALAADQPYAVYYPLLLLGTIGASLGFALPRSLSRRYEELELRRMQALDA